MPPYAEVIGDPIAHSLSPTIHRHWLDRLGLDADYGAVRVAASELAAYLHQRRRDPDWRGCNLTMPLKSPALALVDRLDSAARRIGALNVIVPDRSGLVGLNTDHLAIHRLLELPRRRPLRAAIVGTGGAARAALEVLRQSALEQVDLVTRSPEQARALITEFGLAGDVMEPGGTPVADLLINASPLGMSGYPPLVIDLSAIAADGTVLDMVYAPAETPLLASARRRGLRTIDGLAMLIDQAAASFTCFFGRVPEPTGLDALPAELTS